MNFHFIDNEGGLPFGFCLQQPFTLLKKDFANATTVGFVTMTKKGIKLKTYIFFMLTILRI